MLRFAYRNTAFRHTGTLAELARSSRQTNQLRKKLVQVSRAAAQRGSVEFVRVEVLG